MRTVEAKRCASEIIKDEIAEALAGEKNRLTIYQNKAERIPAKYAALINALEKAKKAAAELSTLDDGGTCNFDTPMLYLQGFTTRLVNRACNVVGLNAGESEDYNFRIYGATDGIGNRRTEMAEAFAESMKESGYNASVWYQID